ncbi:ubiquitin thioesterase OTU1 [Zootermopsis nevadensis]|uniref:Ubiquitin thioesterase OTU n=1 Tax=Zootermopsis nevadensis TaxID=136037 RepID=A0A067QKW3_ZOONE|nr:ubiquitin thioesterase OTU1 [Zootermopsis nevadensis]KDR09586.1 Ubiquitin thioesterase OTU1 [Zootermopsis nevadensis]
MAGFALKLKTKSGQMVIKGLASKDTIFELKRKLSCLTNIKENALYVLSGYPPKPIDLSVNEATLESRGISSGDTLIVEEKQQNIVLSVQQNARLEEPRHHIIDSELGCPGVLMKMVVPADNSCLFTSIGFVLSGKVDVDNSPFMRQIIAESVSNDPDNYSEAILGKPNPEYCHWILKPDSWGGAIELAVLSNFYGLEIAVVDTLNAIINRFGEDQHYAQRVFLMFDGIHYDPLYLEPFEGNSIQTMFLTTDELVFRQAEELAREARSSKQYTDLDRFTLKCIHCQELLSGQIQAQQHAKATGHMNFGEIQ